MDISELKEQWQQLPIWQKILLTVLISVIVSYLLFTLIVSPAEEELKSLEQEVEKLRSEREILSRTENKSLELSINKKLEEIKSITEKNLEELKNLEKAIPPKPKIESLLAFLSSAISASNIELSSFKVEKEEDIYLQYDKASDSLKFFKPDDKNMPKDAVHLKKISVQVLSKGKTTGLFSLLEILSKSDRLINIEKLEIKKEATKLIYSITLSVYFSPEGGK